MKQIVHAVGRILYGELIFIVTMAVGMVFFVLWLALRLAGIAAAVAGGIALLSTLAAWTTYQHAPTAAHWHGLMQTSSLAAACIGVVALAFLGLMWLFSRASVPAPPPAQSAWSRTGRAL